MTENESVYPFELRLMREEELQAAHELELACYPVEAAATREAFTFRQKHFPGYFWSAWQEGVLVGLACGVRTADSSCESDAVKGAHGADNGGRHLCVLSVAVAESCRRHGLGMVLMKALIRQAAADGLESIVLMCEEHLIAFYERLGFRYEGRSASEHGGMHWHEMKLLLA
ncbi:GNAT family N-acetyltransferase [Paenibacillus rhizovicinus]|uniref:GNAT family N-acetyltransferase n=1 Tax=Paenibacillus rhizovicinus TaxID=2704463 RepID=A0A6C0PA83_9BACL|nr:GNAT family N-acetyltransferase [Paenibacillus rhizovicinus]QHW34543.1 GNAT family N-acetyltransferase [Paenibacillus rhizovicinus]